MIFEDYKNALKRLKQDIVHHKCSFLAGAGISMLPPCSLPSGADLKNMALENLLQDQELRPYAEKIKAHPKYGSIVPEIVFQRFYEVLREDLYPFFNILKYANANLAHQSLAFFIEHFDIKVSTTNFDLLIDKFVTKKSNIIHLHGSLTSLATMMIRINQVGRGLESEMKTKFLEELFGKNLYVLGYSGNDKDIIDAITESQVEKIVWFVKSASDPFVLANIKRIDPSRDCYVVECDLNMLFHDLAVAFSTGENAHVIQDNAQDVQKKRNAYIRQLTGTISKAEKFASYGKLLFELEEYITAARVYIKAAEKNFTAQIHNKYWFYTEAANCMRIIGNFQKGFEYAGNVLADESAEKFLSVLAASYNIYGLLLLEKNIPEPENAIFYFKRANDTLNKFSATPEGQLWKEGIEVFRAKILNNLGLVYEDINNFSNALQYYKQALKIKQKFGDLPGIAQSSANIAILYFKFKNFKNVSYWKKKVEWLSEKYQLNYQNAYMHRRIGNLSCQFGQCKKGLIWLRKALHLFKSLEGTAFDIKLTEDAIEGCYHNTTNR